MTDCRLLFYCNSVEQPVFMYGKMGNEKTGK